MDFENVQTPQKIKPQSFWSRICEVSGGNYKTVTPKQRQFSKSVGSAIKTTKYPRTPNGAKPKLKEFAVKTPPAKRFHKVRNPFEPALADRLHLPLIASPSLFQRPGTPQLSSTQFEWTIDEVSLLKPAHVEPHETQFHESPNPDLESRAQYAINSFFKEQLIVPSPVNCPLRNHRIMLSEINSNTPISKPGRRIRDCSTQTELSLPPVLPKEVENALRPYMQPLLAGEGHELKNESVTSDANSSMRRKLFDMHNCFVLDEKNSAKSSSLTDIKIPHITITGKLSDSLDKSSVGSLSPYAHVLGSVTKRKSSMRQYLNEIGVDDQLSPISKGYRTEVNRSEYNTIAELSDHDTKELENNSPNRSTSSLNCYESRFSTDSSFNNRVSRLKVNSSAHSSSKLANKHTGETDLLLHDDTVDMQEDDEDMQVSQLLARSFNCSSSNSDTPRGKRRSASRKNLSQSFSVSWMESDDEADSAENGSEQVDTSYIKVTDKPKVPCLATESVLNQHEAKFNDDERQIFYRTDSGFNDATNISNSGLAQDEFGLEANLKARVSGGSMACSSTPTKRFEYYARIAVTDSP